MEQLYRSPQKANASDWLAVMAGIVGAFLAILDIQITNSSLQQIEGAVGASADEGGWISTAYLIAETVAIPLTGWLASVFSLRNFLLGATSLFLLSSVGCGMCTTLNQLIVFRVLQGLTGGVLVPTAISIVRSRLPAEQQTWGITLFSLVATLAPALGPTVGGWLTDRFNWHYLFFINLGPGSLALLLQFVALKKGKMNLSDLRKGDWMGIILVALGLGSLTVVLEEGRRWDWFDSRLVSALTFVAIISLVSFVVIELTVERPLIKLRLFKIPRISGSFILTAAVGATTFGSLYLVPVYFGEIQNFDTIDIGRATSWSGTPQLILLPFLPMLMRRFDARIIIACGSVLFAVSCFMNAVLTHDSGELQLIMPQVLRALGMPLVMMPVMQLSTAGLLPRDTADASAISTIGRNVGGAIGIAALSTQLADMKVRHFAYLSARVTQNSLKAHDRLAAMAAGVGSGASDESWQRALALMTFQIKREASVMAYSDCFQLMGFAVVISMAAIFLLKKAEPPPIAPRAAGAVPLQAR